MEQTVNIPVQMISVCSTVGDITPMRFRFESEDHSIETVSIDSVLARKNTGYNGIVEIQFTCRASISGIFRYFILIYNITSHKWRLFRMLS